MIQDIQHLIRKLTYCEIHHIFREANQSVDYYIANVGHLVTYEMSIASQNFSKLKEFVYYDALGITFVQKGS